MYTVLGSAAKARYVHSNTCTPITRLALFTAEMEAVMQAVNTGHVKSAGEDKGKESAPDASSTDIKHLKTEV